MAEIGHKLPAEYVALLKKQNGGYIRFSLPDMAHSISTDRGRVDICWGADSGTFTMSWTERKGPPVRPPERRGFGTTVMERMANAA